MPKIDIASLPIKTGSGYPAQFSGITNGRSRKQLGNAGDLTQFGVNLCTLTAGAGSSIRHWHHHEDEFVFILSGVATLIDDDGETILLAGEAACFKAGVPNGHCIVNRSESDVVLLEIGTRADHEIAEYPDIDLKAEKHGSTFNFTHKDGTPY